jgi:hypothetical protein
MKQATQRMPLRLAKGGAPRSSRRRSSGRRCAAQDLWAGRIISTWLYDQVDRNAREVYEGLRMTAKEVESRCA